MRSHVTATLNVMAKPYDMKKEKFNLQSKVYQEYVCFNFSRHVAHSIANKQKITILLILCRNIVYPAL